MGKRFKYLFFGKHKISLETNIKAENITAKSATGITKKTVKHKAKGTMQ